MVSWRGFQYGDSVVTAAPFLVRVENANLLRVRSRLMGHQDLPRWLSDEDRTKLEETRQLAAEELTSLAMNGEPGRVNRPLIKALGGFGVLPQIFPADQ